MPEQIRWVPSPENLLFVEIIVTVLTFRVFGKFNNFLGWGQFSKIKTFFLMGWALRMARIDPSRGGGIEGALAEPVRIQEK